LGNFSTHGLYIEKYIYRLVDSEFAFFYLITKFSNLFCYIASEKTEALPDDGTRLTMMQLAAQVFVFFIAGFETSSTTASFALYELALNPDIQKTLTDEVDDVLAKHDGKITYDSLTEMTYLTKVIEGIPFCIT
jgi:hypothetical protein